MTNYVKALEWKENYLRVIDQRLLPADEVFLDLKTVKDTFDAIEKMVVRGAPLIGFTGLYGLVLHFIADENTSIELLRKDCDYLISARPTAVNLAYEVNRAFDLAKSYMMENDDLKGSKVELLAFANKQVEDIYRHNKTMAELATKELASIYGDKKLNLMTLCNTGALACGPMGTALGVIEHLHDLGKVNHVYASETRPYLQGSRLTAYELGKLGVPYSVTVEGAFSYILSKGLVDAVFIGADRVVANGDTANKIGSATLAIVCRHYDVPFYVVAPLSSFDFAEKSGEGINIEMRDESEVLDFRGERVAPQGARALNPSFDITKSSLISGIICEENILKAPFEESIEKVRHSR